MLTNTACVFPVRGYQDIFSMKMNRKYIGIKYKTNTKGTDYSWNSVIF